MYPMLIPHNMYINSHESHHTTTKKKKVNTAFFNEILIREHPQN